METNRSLQRALLEQLGECYPKSMHAELYMHRNEKEVVRELLYLAEHGLVACKKTAVLSGEVMVSPVTITARGIDFLADDGGLSAILGVVTIKLHEDSLKALIEKKIESAGLPEPEKRLWLDALKAMPAEVAKQLAVRLMDAGISHGPNIMHTVGTFLGIAT